ncbi:MAG: ABC transporter permease [Clostridia bacterium]|nr:ABC transporter permease [Clostridia bacterium]
MKHDRQHEPLIHITARGPRAWYFGMAVRAAAIVSAVLVCALLTWLVTGSDPIRFAESVFKASFNFEANMFEHRFWPMTYGLAILLMLSVAVTPAFRMRFWNIGAEGQTLVGCLATAICMKYFAGAMPNWLIIVCSVICAMAAGALWGLIPAAFKAWFGTNETLFTLMMNYIAMRVVAIFWVIWKGPKSTMDMINQEGPLRGAGWLPQIYNEYLLILIIAVLSAFFMAVYLNRSKHGFEISVVGESPRTANYLGIHVRWVTIRTMILSGALCGLTGMLITSGHDRLIGENMVGGRGFTAVMVSWLAKFNPVIMIFASFLIVFLQRGAKEVNTTISVNESYSDILIGIILFFIIGSEFFIRYRICLRHRRAPLKGGLTHV